MSSLGHREHRPDAHLVRIAARDRVGAEHPQRLGAERGGLLARYLDLIVDGLAIPEVDDVRSLAIDL